MNLYQETIDFLNLSRKFPSLNFKNYNRVVANSVSIAAKYWQRFRTLFHLKLLLTEQEISWFI